MKRILVALLFLFVFLAEEVKSDAAVFVRAGGTRVFVGGGGFQRNVFVGGGGFQRNVFVGGGFQRNVFIGGGGGGVGNTVIVNRGLFRPQTIIVNGGGVGLQPVVVNQGTFLQRAPLFVAPTNALFFTPQHILAPAFVPVFIP